MKSSMKRIDELKINAGKSSSYQQATQWQWQIEKIPVVTLAGGDLDRDGKEEIAVTASAPTDNSNVASAAHLTVFTEESGTLTPVSGLDTVSLADGEHAMVSANCAFGTFSLPDTGITGTVLITAITPLPRTTPARIRPLRTALPTTIRSRKNLSCPSTAHRHSVTAARKSLKATLMTRMRTITVRSMRLSRSAARIWRASVQTTGTARRRNLRF
jgi:hypothetical protein